jgi:hypothetical protein
VLMVDSRSPTAKNPTLNHHATTLRLLRSALSLYARTFIPMRLERVRARC